MAFNFERHTARLINLNTNVQNCAGVVAGPSVAPHDAAKWMCWQDADVDFWVVHGEFVEGGEVPEDGSWKYLRGSKGQLWLGGLARIGLAGVSESGTVRIWFR